MLAARLVSTLLVVTVLSLAGMALLVVAMWAGMIGAGALRTVDVASWGLWVRMVGLTLVLVWVTAVHGLSLATIGRRAAVAVGVLVAYVGGWDLPLSAAISNPGEGIERSMLSMQALSWLAQPHEFAGSNIAGPFPRVEAGLMLVALAFAASVAAFVIEHRRGRSSVSAFQLP